MTFQDYQDLFDAILNGKITTSPYDDEHFIEYVKLNQSRQNRWLKKGKINHELQSIVERINKPQHWILITEPWCGDASHSVPFICMLAQLNTNIHLEIQLRDADNSEIGNYLTNESKSIPKLVVRDSNGKDLFNWGPRPKKCQDVYDEMKSKEVAFVELKKALQDWYNNDNGESLQNELKPLLETTIYF
jgi:hypothetical protein